MAYFESTKLTDSSGNVIDPAEKQTLYDTVPAQNVPAPITRTVYGTVDENIILLRRITKLLESQATIDTAQRQRITLDAITAGVALPQVTTVSTVTTVTTVTTVSTVSTVTNLAAVAGWNQQMFTDPARTSYNTGIRSRLTFS